MLPPLRQCDSITIQSHRQPNLPFLEPSLWTWTSVHHLSCQTTSEMSSWTGSMPTRRSAIPQRGNLPQRIYAALHAIDEAEMQRQQQAMDPPIRRHSLVPPGFEAPVAQSLQ